VRPDAIIATNTSSLPVMDIAVVTQRPNRVLGFHFFNPAQVMQLIELVRTVVTDEAVVETAQGFAERIGKVPVVVGDRRGFIANQLLFPYLNQAVGMVEGGYATKEDVDTAMRLGHGLPMGPIALADLVGHRHLRRHHGRDPRPVRRPPVRPAPDAQAAGLRRLHRTQGGRGFYRYEEPGSSRTVPDERARAPPTRSLVAGWRRVGVIGTGTMATGIAEVCARPASRWPCAGAAPRRPRRPADKVSSLGRQVDKGRLDAEERDRILAASSHVTDLVDLADCDVVVEAVAEDLEVKRELFAEPSTPS
jgi:3-hydroxybutyryl-CoA dehydrogenase